MHSDYSNLKEQYQEIGERLISESTVSLIDEGTTALISVLKKALLKYNTLIELFSYLKIYKLF